MRKYIFLLCIIIFMLSCKKGKEISVTEIRHKDLNVENLIMGIPVSMVLTKNYLIIEDRKTDTIFSVIDVDSKKIKKRFGVHGNGPEEYLSPDRIFYKSPDTFVFTDVNKRTLYQLEFNFKSNDFFKIRKLLSFDSFGFTSIFPLQDSDKYMAFGVGKPKLCYVLNKNGKIENQYLEYPYKDDKEKNIGDEVRSFAYQGPVAVNKRKPQMAKISNSGKIICFYKIVEDKPVKILEKIENYPEYKEVKKGTAKGVVYLKNDMTGYVDVSVTDERVFAIYSGKTYKEYKLKDKDCEVIYEYDWTGKLLKKYHTDVSLHNICISDDNKTLYAIASDSDPKIVVFDLK